MICHPGNYFAKMMAISVIRLRILIQAVVAERSVIFAWIVRNTAIGVMKQF